MSNKNTLDPELGPCCLHSVIMKVKNNEESQRFYEDLFCMRPVARYSESYEEHLIMEGGDTKTLTLHFVQHDGCHVWGNKLIHVAEFREHFIYYVSSLKTFNEYLNMRKERHNFHVYSEPSIHYGVKSMQLLDPSGYMLVIIQLDKPISFVQFKNKFPCCNNLPVQQYFTKSIKSTSNSRAYEVWLSHIIIPVNHIKEICDFYENNFSEIIPKSKEYKVLQHKERLFKLARGDNNKIKVAGVDDVPLRENLRYGFHIVDYESIKEILTTCYWFSNFMRFQRSSICFKENLRNENKLDNGIIGLKFIVRDFLYLHGNLKNYNTSDVIYDIITKTDSFTCFDPEGLKLSIHDLRIKEII